MSAIFYKNKLYGANAVDIVEGYYYNSKFYVDSAHTIEILGEHNKLYIDLPDDVMYRWDGTFKTVSGGGSITPNPSGTATANLEKVTIESTIYAIKDTNAVHSTDKGVANGVASLDVNGKVPSAQLPSYVDDVLEYASLSDFPATGESGKIYIAVDTNKSYRWSGSTYVEISSSLALGETSSTAYRGDRGKTAYDHATESGKISAAVASGLYKIAATAQGHIAGLTAVEKADITALGIPESMPTVNNSTITIQKNSTTVDTFTLNQSTDKTINISVPTKTSDLTNDSGFITSNLITGVKGDAESTYRMGNVNITAANVGAVKYRGNLSSIGSGTPIAAAKTYWTDNISNLDVNIAYNNSGTEYTIIFSRGGSNKYGTILKYGYEDKYLYIARNKNGTWQANDWEKISAGYADEALKASQNADGVAFGDLATINKGSGSSKFLREDGTWQTVSVSWSGGSVTSNIVPSTADTCALGTASKRFDSATIRTIDCHDIGAEVYYVRGAGFSGRLYGPVSASSAQDFYLPNTGGTLLTDTKTTGTITKAGNAANTGTLDNTYCVKRGGVAYVAGRVHTMANTTVANGTFFSIPTGFRPAETTKVMGGIRLVSPDTFYPMLVEITTGGNVNFYYSAGSRTTQVYFCGCYPVA